MAGLYPVDVSYVAGSFLTEDFLISLSSSLVTVAFIGGKERFVKSNACCSKLFCCLLL